MMTLFHSDPSVTLNQPMNRIPWRASYSFARFGKKWRIPRLKIVSRPLRTLKKVTISGTGATPPVSSVGWLTDSGALSVMMSGAAVAPYVRPRPAGARRRTRGAGRPMSSR